MEKVVQDSLSFLTILFIIIPAGLFGGIVSAIFDMLKEKNLESAGNSIETFIGRALVGVGGALGIIFFGYSVKTNHS